MSSLTQANPMQAQSAATPPEPLVQASGGGLDPQIQAQIKAQMADIIEPSAIGLWPLAWGWWILIAIGMAVLIFAIYTYIRHRNQNRYRRLALQSLDKQTFDSRHQQSLFLMHLCKQVALAAYPKDRDLVAKANGEQWLQWLNNTTATPLFVNSNAQRWQDELYSRPTQAEPDSALTQLVKDWIKKHNRKKTREYKNV